MLRAGESKIILIFCFCFTIHANACARNKFDINQLYREKHISALILARGGSKGIPLKNISKIGNTTLLASALKQAKEVGFDSIWVSTDSPKIFNVILPDSENIHWRSEESATDTASSVFAINEFLRFRPEIDAVALIQCTSPFQKKLYLKQALNLILNGKDCVFSVTRSFKLRWTSDKEKLLPLNFHTNWRPRRQDWNGELIENGMFYFAKRSLLHQGLLQNSKFVCLFHSDG